MYKFHHKVVVFLQGIAWCLPAIINLWLPPAGKKEQSALYDDHDFRWILCTGDINSSPSEHKASWTEYAFIFI